MKGKRLNYFIWAAILLAVLVVPFFAQRYTVHILILAGIYIIMAVGLSLVSGFAGQLSLGQAAFYAVGAYVSALLAVNIGLSFWLALIAGTIVAGLTGIVLGIPTLRLSGVYLTVATVGFGEIVRLVIMNWTPVTRGAMGVLNVPPPSIFGFLIDSPERYYYLVLAAVGVSLFLASRIVNSRVGRAFISVADKEVAAQSVGINPTYYKTLAFVLSACFAGAAGSFYAHYIGYIHPDAFTQAESILAVTIMAVGGVRSFFGIAVSAVVLVTAMEYLRAFSEFRLIVYALMLILSLIFMPNGVGGIARNIIDARKKRKMSLTKQARRGE
jgi:branched-chain amino acid transport system permease protein